MDSHIHTTQTQTLQLISFGTGMAITFPIGFEPPPTNAVRIR